MKSRIIDLKQGSKEWLEFRKGKIGASMVASCIGIKGAFHSKEEAKDIILGRKEVYQNPAMQKGLFYEELIRKKAEFLHGVSIEPVVFCGVENESFMASLDGMDAKGDIYEFKYSNKEFSQVKTEQKPSEKYFAQVQFQLYLSNAKRCFFIVMNEERELVECEVKSDAKYQKWLVKELENFMIDYFIDDKKDTEELTSTKALSLAKEINALENSLKPKLETLEKLKKELISLAKGQRAKCLNISIYPQTRMIVDYKGFLEKEKLTPPKEFYKESVSMCLKVKKA